MALNRPRLSIGLTRVAYIGPALDLSPHRNAAATIAVAIAHPFRLGLGRTRVADDTTPRHIALVLPGTWHHLVASGPMAFLYLDAQAADLDALGGIDLDAAYSRLVPRMAEAGSSWDADQWCDALGLPPPVAADPRLVALLPRIDAEPDEFASVDALASALGLSRSRTQALFTEALGLPFRRYRLWRRMARVMALLQGGSTLTDAALDAGFASASHLATAFRAQFGLAPSHLMGQAPSIDWVPPRQPG